MNIEMVDLVILHRLLIWQITPYEYRHVRSSNTSQATDLIVPSCENKSPSHMFWLFVSNKCHMSSELSSYDMVKCEKQIVLVIMSHHLQWDSVTRVGKVNYMKISAIIFTLHFVRAYIWPLCWIWIMINWWEMFGENNIANKNHFISEMSST